MARSARRTSLQAVRFVRCVRRQRGGRKGVQHQAGLHLPLLLPALPPSVGSTDHAGPVARSLLPRRRRH